MVAVKRTDEVQTVSVDEFTADLRPIHFIRADIQGAELEAIEGGSDTLRDVLMIVAEVAYAPLYIGGPLWRDVDLALSARGFAFYKPASSSSWHERPFVMEGKEFRRRLEKPFVLLDGKAIQQRSSTIPSGRMLWGDVIYVREDIRELNNEALRRLALLAHLYGCFTLAASCKERYAGRSYAEQYLTYVLAYDAASSEKDEE